MAMRGPRFEQMNMEFQPQPLSAMEMVQREPIRLSHKRVTSCDGGQSREEDPERDGMSVLTYLHLPRYITGSGALGHPRVFINLVRSNEGLAPAVSQKLTSILPRPRPL